MFASSSSSSSSAQDKILRQQNCVCGGILTPIACKISRSHTERNPSSFPILLTVQIHSLILQLLHKIYCPWKSFNPVPVCSRTTLMVESELSCVQEPTSTGTAGNEANSIPKTQLCDKTCIYPRTIMLAFCTRSNGNQTSKALFEAFLSATKSEEYGSVAMRNTIGLNAKGEDLVIYEKSGKESVFGPRDKRTLRAVCRGRPKNYLEQSRREKSRQAHSYTAHPLPHSTAHQGS